MNAGDAKKTSKLRAWGQLLRLPNLLTVPGDPIMGFLLFRAGGPLAAALVPAAGASVLLYAAGLLANDFFDAARDRRSRPDRPIPSGRASRGAVAAVAVLLAAGGVAAAYLASPLTGHVAAVLLACIVAYDAGAKRIAALGPILMGACRALSVGVGIAAAGADLACPPAWIVPGWVLVYIASVTAIARYETSARRVGWMSNLPAAVLAAGFTFIIADATSFETSKVHLAVFVLLALAAVVSAARAAIRIARAAGPSAVQKSVGELIRTLMLVQAAMVSVTGWTGLCFAAGLVAGWVVSGLLARRFYAS